jgi:hypothetical protein
MKKIVLAISCIVALAGMVIPASTSAASVASPASASTKCSTQYYLLFANVGWGWSSPSSPHYVYEHTRGSQTSYCRKGSNPHYHFVQYGTSRCLQVKTSNRTLIEGSCSGTAAEWHQINVRPLIGLEEVELQSADTRGCIWERGVDRTLTYDPCNPRNGNDLFLFQ